MTEAQAPARRGLNGHSELGVAALLAVLGSICVWDANTLADNAASRGPLSSAVMPTTVGALLLVTAVALAIDVWRGGQGDVEGGEDVDLDEPTAWVPFVAIVGVFLGNALLMERLGWPVTGALLFWGAAVALGSRRPVRDLVIASVLAVGSYALFANLLGINLPVGLLEGVL